MGYQDDYVMRIISGLVRAIARLVLDKNDIDYDLPEDEDRYTGLDRVYRGLKDLVDEGNINDAENLLTDELDTDSLDCLEMTPTFYVYLSQLKNDELYTANYSREGIVGGINSICAECGISGFEHLVDTTMVQCAARWIWKHMCLAAFTNIWKKEGAHGDKKGVRAVSGGVLPGPVLWKCGQTLPGHDRCRTQETPEPVD